MRIVVVWRPPREAPQGPKGPKAFGRRKPLEAFFSTDGALSVHATLGTYEDRWAMEIAMRDGHAYYGVAQDHCRNVESLIGVNTFRLLMAAARTLWCIVSSAQHAEVALQ